MEDGEPYGGDSSYDNERESFYSDLNQRIGSSILGLVFLSGDIHIHEVYDIELASQSGGPVKLAPEFVSLTEATKELAAYETWSRFCLENLDALRSRAAAAGVAMPERAVI